MRGIKEKSEVSIIHTIQRKQNIIGVCILLLASIVALTFLLRVMTDPQNTTPTTVTLTGVTVCLPHKDTSGPTTLECTIGLQGDDGRYYALITPTGTLPADVNKNIHVTGTLSPPKGGERYNIAGTIEITSLQEQ